MINTLGIIILSGSCVYHIIAGLAVLGPHSWTRIFGKKLYDLTFPDQFGPQYDICLKALGIFALTLSAFCFRAAISEDIIYRQFTLQVLAALFFGRAIFRIVRRDLFYKAYKIDLKRSLVNIFFNITLAVLTLVTSL